MSDQTYNKKPRSEAFLKADASRSPTAGGGGIGADDKDQAKIKKEPIAVVSENSARTSHDTIDQKHPAGTNLQAPQRDGDVSETAQDAGGGGVKRPDQEPDQENEGISAKLRTHPIAVAAGFLVLICAVFGGFFWYLHSRHFANTDDAFIDGRPISISLQVTGNIVAVPVTDNQIVKVGDLLVQIDDRDYRAAVDLAQAQIEQAQANVDNFSAQIYAQEPQITQAATQVVQAQATLDFSKEQDTRYQDLLHKGAGTAQRAQQSASEFQANTAALGATQAAKAVADRQTNVLKAQFKSAQAQLAQAHAQKTVADANLTRTQIRATADGRVTRLTAAVGQLATQAQGVMILVPLDIWVTANFKETQLADLKVGQPVEIAVDAFGRNFSGHIESVQSGSGTAFSLLPAQNATGNYVKVVQRVPVKITFDRRPDVQLGPGMSVVPKVTIR